MKIRAISSIVALAVSATSLASQKEEADAIVSADFVIQFFRANIEVKPDGTSKWFVDEQYLSQTEMGRTKLGWREVVFSPDLSRVKVTKAQSITYGQKVPTDLKLVVERSESPSEKMGVSDIRKLIIPFNNVKSNSAVGFSYELDQTHTVVPGIASFVFVYGLTEPELSGKVELTSSKPLQVYVSRPDIVQVSRSMVGSTHKLTLVQSKPTFLKPSLEKFALIPPKLKPIVHVSSAQSWSEIVGPVSKDYEAVVDQPLPPEFQKIVASASLLKTDTEKFDHVLTELNKVVGYSGDWTTKHKKFVPQGHLKVLKDGKGDCKDFAASMAAMLRKLGFNAHVALTLASPPHDRTFRDLDFTELVPTTDIFNHAVTTVLLADGKRLWLDGTRSIPFSHGAWPDIAGAPALVLDGKSTRLERIPETTGKLSKTEVVRTAQFDGSDFARWTGTYSASDDGVPMLAFLDRTIGRGKLESLMPTILLGELLKNEKTKVTLPAGLEFRGSRIEIPFETIGASPVQESRTGRKALLAGSVDKIAGYFSKTGFYVGSPRETTTTTIIKQLKVDDVVQGDCFALSPWADLERKVETKGPDTIVTEKFTTKALYVTDRDIASDTYKIFLNHARGCLASAVVPLEPAGEGSKAPPSGSIRSLPLSKESLARAEQIYFGSREMEGHYGDLKLIRVFDSIPASDPSHGRARALRAGVIKSLGYISGDKYVGSYLERALRELDNLIQEQPDLAIAYRIRAEVHLDAGRQDFAFRDAVKAYGLEPNSFHSRIVMANYYIRKADYGVAEKWLEAAQSIATTDSERRRAWKYVADLTQARRDWKASVMARREILKLDPESPWAMHNLAMALGNLGEIDEAIEIERKALAKMDFGMARMQLSWLLAKKSTDFRKTFTDLKWASDRENEKRLIESYKLDPTLSSTLFELSLLYFSRMQVEKETDWLDNVDIYLNEGLAQHPEDPAFKVLEKSVNQMKATVIADFKKNNRPLSGRWPATFRGQHP